MGYRAQNNSKISSKIYLMEERFCNKCFKIKPRHEMIKGDRYKGGIRPVCVKCFNKYYYSSKRYKK